MATPEEYQAKAAATYRRPTRAFADVINKNSPATATLPGVFASPEPT